MFSIGQVEEITGVKQHVLRYWEEVIPSFAPQKDFGGRRVYSQSDVEKIFRLKYLIYQKKFTIEGARNQLINEGAVKSKSSLIEIQKIRSELIHCFFMLKRHREKIHSSIKNSPAKILPQTQPKIVFLKTRASVKN